MVNSESKSTKYLILISLLVVLFLVPTEAIWAQGSIFGTVTNSDLSTPANGEISFFGFIDDSDKEIKIESSVGAGYDAGNWYDFFPNYLTVSPGDPYDYYFYNIVNGEGFPLSGIISDQGIQTENIALDLVDWPPQPTGLAGHPLSTTSIEITWTNHIGLTYHVYRRQSSSNGSFFRIDDPSGSLGNPGVSAGSFVDNDVETGIGYHYLIIAQYTPGNYSPHSEFVEVISQTPEDPVISCPGDIIIECLSSSEPEITGYATATDNIDPDPVIIYSDVITAGDCPQEQIISRTWTATDSDKNSSDCLQIITISDRTKPVIACPPDTFVYFGESTDPDSTGTASADDN
ncbi:MAG: fibronectin type III domain-containing protein, partial [candidate division Zixibacteria bacterium]|nr:fibronectin type III domain-containing protein [candidate division Zixibacteria bacterium]